MCVYFVGCDYLEDGAEYGCAHCPYEERIDMIIVNSCRRLNSGDYFGPPSSSDGVEVEEKE